MPSLRAINVSLPHLKKVTFFKKNAFFLVFIRQGHGLAFCARRILAVRELSISDWRKFAFVLKTVSRRSP